MDFLIKFYQDLDTFNLIIFWGIIIIIILLLIFVVIIINKNKKLKQTIKEKENIHNNEDIPIIKKNDQFELSSQNNEQDEYEEKTETKTETENLFIVEEHIPDYQKEIQSSENDFKEIDKEQKEEISEKEISFNDIPHVPYQRNVLKEMSLGQTSPIGIIKPKKKELDNAIELNETLKDNIDIESKEQPFLKDTPQLIQKEIKEESLIYKDSNKIQTESNIYNQDKKTNSNIEKSLTSNSTLKDKLSNSNSENNLANSKNDNYLETVSQKLANAKQQEGINRTNYEIEQEEQAIISYEELMRKKDSIQIIDEEDAVISIEELINQNKSKEKLYNLTEEEENEKFLKELKDFRNDL